jgi:hypothetical protein
VPLVAFAASCSFGDDGVPTELFDGSPARRASVMLDGVTEPTVLTRARVVRVDALDPGSATAECLEGRGSGVPAAGLAVERVGVTSESVTLREASGRALMGCDDSPGDREADRRWCGGAHGILVSGRLRDPRLSILCTTDDGARMGFVWIQPQPATRYVAVEQPGFVEVYEPRASLPVRIASTADVDVERSSATFAISEHDAAGALVRRYELHAAVAG